MASRLACQLQSLAQSRKSAAPNTNRQQPSFLFQPNVAARFDNETMFTSAIDSLHELIEIDGRFRPFLETLFKPGTWQIDIDILPRENVGRLLIQVENMLSLLSANFLLPPAHNTIEYLVRQYRVQKWCRDSFICMALPYYQNPAFHRIAGLVSLTDQWSFLKPSFDRDEGYATSTLVNRACEHASFFQIVLQVASRGAELAKTGSSNHAAVSFSFAVVKVVIERKAIREAHLRVLLPFLHKSLNHKKTFCLQLRSFAESTAIAVSPFLSANAVNALVASIITGVDSDSNVEQVEKAITFSASIFKCRRADWPLPEKAFTYAVGISRLSDAFANKKGCSEIKTFVEALIAHLIQSGNLSLARSLISDATDASASYLQCCIDLAIKSNQNVECFRRDLGFGILDQFRHQVAHVRLTAFASLELQVLQGHVSPGAASAAYYDCLNDSATALVTAVLRSPTTPLVVDSGSICNVIRGGLDRFDGDLARSAALALSRYDHDECAVVLVDLAILHPSVLADSVGAVHAVFKEVDCESLCQTLANGTTSTTLPLVLEMLCSRHVLLPVVEMLPAAIVSEYLPKFIETISNIGSDIESSLLKEFDMACQAVAKTTTDIDAHRELFEIASQIGASNVISYIAGVHADDITIFLTSLWERRSVSAPVIVSAIEQIQAWAPSNKNLSFLVPHLLCVISHPDILVRHAVVNTLSMVSPFCRPNYESIADNSLSPCFLAKIDFGAYIEKITLATEEIRIDRFWIRHIPIDAPALTALFRSCLLLHSDEARVALLSNLSFPSLDSQGFEYAVKIVNADTCLALLPKIAESFKIKQVGTQLASFLHSSHPNAVIESTLKVFNVNHYKLLSPDAQIALLLRLSELLNTVLSQSASDVLENLKISGEIAAAVIKSISDAPQRMPLIRAWSNPDRIINASPYVVALVDLLDCSSADPVIATDILKSLLNFDHLSEYVTNEKIAFNCLVERSSLSRDASVQAVILLTSLAAGNVKTVTDLMLPVLSNMIPFLSSGDTFASTVFIDALKVFAPAQRKPVLVCNLLINAWPALPSNFREAIFHCAISLLKNLGNCTVQLISRFNADSFPFCHALFSRCSASEQIIGLADMLRRHGCEQLSKRRKHSSAIPMPPVLEFIASRLDNSSFVSIITNTTECNDAFVKLYEAVLSEPESDWLDLIIKNMIAVASLPSFVSHLGALTQSCSERNASLRGRALQLLNDKLEAACWVGSKMDEVVPSLDALLPNLLAIVTNNSEPDANKQLALLAADALSGICPDDVVTPFIEMVPRILTIIPLSATELRSCALMTLGSIVAKLGPHSLKFISIVIPVLLDHVATFQTSALSALCVIVTSLPKFLAPHLQAMFKTILSPAAIQCDVSEQIFRRLASGVPPRILITAIAEFERPHEKLLELLRSVIVNFMVSKDIKAHRRSIFQLCLKSFETRESSVCDVSVAVFTSLAVRLKDSQLSRLFASLLEWAGPSRNSSEDRHLCLFGILDDLLDCLEVRSMSYVNQVIDLITGALSSKTALPHLVCSALSILRKSCQHDSEGTLVSKPKFDAILVAFTNRIKLSCSIRSPGELKSFEADYLQPCAADISARFSHEMYWKPMAHELLQLTRNSKSGVRHAAFICLHGMMKRLGEPLLVIMPEMLPYLSEALEDDDVDVESAVRDLLTLLEQISGENMEDYLK